MQLRCEQPNQYELHGIISCDTVTNIDLEFDEAQKGFDAFNENILCIDLSHIEKVDSCALAMFIGWIRKASLLSCKIYFLHPPASLMAIAHISRLDHLFSNQSSK